MQSIPKRCQKEGCKCKLTLTSFPCRCEKYFCNQHRFSGDHACTYDYKKEHTKELNKYLSSPVIAAKVAII